MNDRQFCQRLRKSFWSLRLKTWGEDLVVRQGDVTWFEITAAYPGVQVTGPHTQAHRKSLEDAFDLIIMLLSGDARSVEEFRDGTLAASWIEIRQGTAFFQSDLVSHLPPFDEAEWTPRDQEVWRTRRFYYERVGEDLEQRYTDLASLEPQGVRPELFGWLNETLGSPIKGLRWTQGPDDRCLLQVPVSWRKVVEEDPGYSDFESPTDNPFLRIALYYSEPAKPQTPGRQATILASRQDYELVEEGGWMSDRYSLVFHGEDIDMLAVLQAFWPTSDPEPAEFRESVRLAAPLTRMTPRNWSVRAE